MSNGFDEVFSAVSQPDELLEHYQLSHDPFAARAQASSSLRRKESRFLPSCTISLVMATRCWW